MPARLGCAAAGALVAAGLAGCVTTLGGEARRARESGADPLPLVERLAAQHGAIVTTRRIFNVTLIEGGRRFAGAGAVEYRGAAGRLGPHHFRSASRSCGRSAHRP